MLTFLLLSIAVIIGCIVFSKISNRLGLPMLLAFILLGMFFGSDGVVKIDFDNYSLAGSICSVALIFIMFYGGFGTRWEEAKTVAKKAVMLSTIGVVITAGLTALFCMFVLRMKPLESLLLGSIVSSTDAASVFSILRSKKLNLKYKTASLLELESGSNDPIAYMLTIGVLSLMGDPSYTQSLPVLLLQQIVVGVVAGVIIAYASIEIVNRFNFDAQGFDTIFVFAIALLAYALPTLIGGNGYLSVYLLGIIMGNRPLRNKKQLVHFFDGITGLMQMLIFFLLGLLSFPSEMPKVIVPALLIAIFLTIVARPVSIYLLLKPFGSPKEQIWLTSLAGLRGAASIVFATLVIVSPAYTEHDLFHIVFCIVLFSILIQGYLLPYASKRWQMIDSESNVMKTFNDFSESLPIQFVKVKLDKGHPWLNMKIKDIILPPETLIVAINRGTKKIPLNGDTNIYEMDELIIAARSIEDKDTQKITEITIEPSHKWQGKTISEIDLDIGNLVLLIVRQQDILIPSGQTLLTSGDMVYISTLKD
ncbi:MAG: K+/H+ antiporter [Clostridiales bacterium 38-18]|nr:MAG: K+/H+ antiporter [Clostridiales bacterium 38-18]